jgi:hypothetical protein
MDDIWVRSALPFHFWDAASDLGNLRDGGISEACESDWRIKWLRNRIVLAQCLQSGVVTSTYTCTASP